MGRKLLGGLRMQTGSTLVEQIEHHWTWRSRERASEWWCETRGMVALLRRRRTVNSSELCRDSGTASKTVTMCSRNLLCASLCRIRHIKISHKKESHLITTCTLWTLPFSLSETSTKWSTRLTTLTPTSISSRSPTTRSSLRPHAWPLRLPNHWPKSREQQQSLLPMVAKTSRLSSTARRILR